MTKPPMLPPSRLNATRTISLLFHCYFHSILLSTFGKSVGSCGQTRCPVSALHHKADLNRAAVCNSVMKYPHHMITATSTESLRLTRPPFLTSPFWSPFSDYAAAAIRRALRLIYILASVSFTSLHVLRSAHFTFYASLRLQRSLPFNAKSPSTIE